jgi:hypothetical protein
MLFFLFFLQICINLFIYLYNCDIVAKVTIIHEII